MADEQSEQDRSEAPSHFKLMRARKKGAVARGPDLGFVVSLSAFTIFLWLRGGELRDQLTIAFARVFAMTSAMTGDSAGLVALSAQATSQMLRPLAFLGTVLFVAVLVFELVQTGFVFSLEPLKLNFGRLNPAQNFK